MRPTEPPVAAGEPLGARLGGSRQEFDATYGAPVRYLGQDQVEYQVAEFGQTVVTFADDRARRIVLASPRPLTKPLGDADPADWSVVAAQEAANRFLPADAIWDPQPAARQGEVSTSGRSATLATAIEPPIGACAGTGEAAFTARLTMPSDRTVSMVTLELEPVSARADIGTEPPALPAVATSDVATGSSSANVAIGGTNGEDGAPGADATAASVTINVRGGGQASTTANGVKVRLVGEQRNAAGLVAPPTGTTFFALNLEIENGGRGPLRVDLANFRLTDNGRRDHAAVCGGPEPAIADQELSVGQTLRGWIAFAVPAGAEPARFTYEIAPGVTVSFAVA
jgi:hypothetical protein